MEECKEMVGCLFMCGGWLANICYEEEGEEFTTWITSVRTWRRWRC
jgi:hypothetical protein|tara:strand:+ start:319 stop:456 length:138 start_codon:yes stop_codon:yes gene_type:complete